MIDGIYLAPLQTFRLPFSCSNAITRHGNATRENEMSAVHDLAKSLNRPTVDQIMGAIAADLAFMESEFRTEDQKLSMSDAMPALFKALAPRCFAGDEKDMIDALFEVMAAERAWVWDKEERAGRYCNAVVDFRGESERFGNARAKELAEEGFEV